MKEILYTNGVPNWSYTNPYLEEKKEKAFLNYEGSSIIGGEG